MLTTLLILLMVGAYLMGSIPSGLIIGKLFYHKDLREFGSGNIGTTNAFRALGVTGGFIVFACDMLKGAIPVLITNQLDTGIHPMFIGLFAIAGHTFPIFLKFKGGKAVATSFGVAMAYVPVFALIAIAIFFIVLYLWRMVSLSSIVAVICAFFISFFWRDLFLSTIVFAVMILVIVRHQANIQRIRAGNESKVPFGRGYKKP